MRQLFMHDLSNGRVSPFEEQDYTAMHVKDQGINWHYPWTAVLLCLLEQIGLAYGVIAYETADHKTFYLNKGSCIKWLYTTANQANILEQLDREIYILSIIDVIEKISIALRAPTAAYKKLRDYKACRQADLMLATKNTAEMRNRKKFGEFTPTVLTPIQE